MKPPIELPTIEQRSIPSSLAEVADEMAISGDRDLPRRHRARPETRQVERDDPVGAGEVRDVLQPVLPAPGEAVDEDQRGALSHFDVVDPRPDYVDLPKMLAPVDPQPLGIRVAVGVRTVSRRGRGKVHSARGQADGVGRVGGDPAKLVADLLVRGGTAHARNVPRRGPVTTPVAAFAGISLLIPPKRRREPGSRTPHQCSPRRTRA